jgi:hypothetical protein
VTAQEALHRAASRRRNLIIQTLCCHSHTLRMWSLYRPMARGELQNSSLLRSPAHLMYCMHDTDK